MRWEQVEIIDNQDGRHKGRAALDFSRKVLGKQFPDSIRCLDEGSFYVFLSTREPIIDAPGLKHALRTLLAPHVNDVLVKPVGETSFEQAPSPQHYGDPLPVQRKSCSCLNQWQKSVCWFGTDLPVELSDQDARSILVDALQAGFTSFDTAYTYALRSGTRTIKLLDEAAAQAKVNRQRLTVLYKVTKSDLHGPPPDLDVQLELFNRIAWGTCILALHDIEANPLKPWAERVCRKAKELKMEFGVSNLDWATFDEIYSMASETKCPLTHVENRFTPYTTTQHEVIAKCREHGVRYLAYGIGGSSFRGSCDSVAGNPTDLVSARLDQKLLEVCKNDAGDVMYSLCHWAAQQNIFPIVFTTKKDHMPRYVKPEEVPNSFATALFAYANSRKHAEVEWSRKFYFEVSQLLKPLITMCPSPLAWRLIKSLLDQSMGDFVESVVRKVGQYMQGMEDRFGYNLLRLAFAFQDLHRKEPNAAKKWEESVTEAFKGWKAAKSNATLECVAEWACKQFSEKGTGGGVEDVVKAIRTGKYQPAFPITPTGKTNVGLKQLMTVTLTLESHLDKDTRSRLEKELDAEVNYSTVVTAECSENNQVKFAYFCDNQDAKAKRLAIEQKVQKASRVKSTQEASSWQRSA